MTALRSGLEPPTRYEGPLCGAMQLRNGFAQSKNTSFGSTVRQKSSVMRVHWADMGQYLAQTVPQPAPVCSAPSWWLGVHCENLGMKFIYEACN